MIEYVVIIVEGNILIVNCLLCIFWKEKFLKKKGIMLFREVFY